MAVGAGTTALVTGGTGGVGAIPAAGIGMAGGSVVGGIARETVRHWGERRPPMTDEAARAAAQRLAQDAVLAGAGGMAGGAFRTGMGTARVQQALGRAGLASRSEAIERGFESAVTGAEQAVHISEREHREREAEDSGF